VPGKDFRRNSVAEFSRTGQDKTNKAASGEEKLEYEMTFSGTLIDDLMATVERAEQRVGSDEPLFAEFTVAKPWLASLSLHENTDYDSKFIGVA
jgi:hypothetical protein